MLRRAHPSRSLRMNGEISTRIPQLKYPMHLSEARAWSCEGTEPYSFNVFLQSAPCSQSVETQLICTTVRNLLGGRGPLPSRRKACASHLTWRQLRNQGSNSLTGHEGSEQLTHNSRRAALQLYYWCCCNRLMTAPSGPISVGTPSRYAIT